MEDLVELKIITKNEFEKLNNEYIDKENGNVHFFYLNDQNNSFTYGIYYNNELIGFIVCNKLMLKNNNVEVRTFVKPEYRGKRISPLAKEKLINKTGEIFDDCMYYISLIDYKNQSSIKSAENAGWNFDWELTEMVSEESSDCLQVYTKYNAFYNNKKRLVNIYDRK